MKRTFLLMLITCFNALFLIGQSSEKVFTFMEVNVKPQFPGGDLQLFKFMSKNLVFEKGIEFNGNTKTVASFVVDKTGKIKNIKIVKSISAKIDAAVIQCIKKMPSWKPASHKGKKVSVLMNLPIRLEFK